MSGFNAFVVLHISRELVNFSKNHSVSEFDIVPCRDLNEINSIFITRHSLYIPDKNSDISMRLSFRDGIQKGYDFGLVLKYYHKIKQALNNLEDEYEAVKGVITRKVSGIRVLLRFWISESLYRYILDSGKGYIKCRNVILSVSCIRVSGLAFGKSTDNWYSKNYVLVIGENMTDKIIDIPETDPYFFGILKKYLDLQDAFQDLQKKYSQEFQIEP